MRMHDTVVYTPTLSFQSSFFSFRALAAFFPPFFCGKDECSLHSPFKVPETWENMSNRGKLALLSVLIQNKIKPDDRGRQIYLKHLLLQKSYIDKINIQCIITERPTPLRLFIYTTYIRICVYIYWGVWRKALREKLIFFHLFCKCDTGNVSF